MESQDELIAPKPVRSCKRPFRSNNTPAFLELDIPSLKKSNSAMSSPSSMTSSTSTYQESETGQTGNEAQREQEQFEKELTKLLNDDFAFESFKRSSFIMPQFIQRPQNPYFENFESQNE